MRREHAKLLQRSLGLAVATALLVAASATAQTTQRVSLGVDDDQNGSDDQAVLWSEHSDLTPDGKYIVFASAAWNLLMLAQPPGVPLDTGRVHIYRRDTQAGHVVLASVDSLYEPNDGDSADPSISDDGLRIAFASDGPQAEAMYFFSIDQWGGGGDLGWDVFVRDLSLDVSQTRLISFGWGTDKEGKAIQVSANGESRQSQISGNGKHVVYASRATNLSSSDADDLWDIYVYDWDAVQEQSTNTLVSVNTLGVKGDRDCVSPSISDNGRYIVFQSNATNLVDRSGVDAGANSMIFLHDRDADGDGIFDEPGAISTKLLSRVGLPVQ